jgi:hypothetical protein
MVPSTFFFMFSQLGVGMMLCLLFLSPRRIGNGFFKFASLTAGILMGVPLAFDFFFPSPFRTGNWPEILLLVSILLTILYHRVIDLDKFSAANALLIGAVATGLVSITWDSLAFTRMREVAGMQHWLLAANNLAGAALLGAVLLAMVFGHWYLVIPKLSIDHLMTLTKVLMATVLVRMLSVVVTLALINQEPSLPLDRVLSVLMLSLFPGLFFWTRLICGIIAPVVLAWMVYNTVQLKHTQAATGLLYVAVVVLLLGEFMSKFLLFDVQLPF